MTQIESITYNEEAIGKWLVSSLESQGYNVEKQFVDEDAGRFNIYAHAGETRETKVLVSSHIDTVSYLYYALWVSWLRRHGRSRHFILTNMRTRPSMAAAAWMIKPA